MTRRRALASSDYRFEHTAPDKGSAPIFDLTHNGIYPRDVYTRSRDYLGTHRSDAAALRVILEARGRPTHLVTVYRAMPKAIALRERAAGRTGINPGDWIAITRAYADDHARYFDASEPAMVVSARVPAAFVFTDGNSLQEWGFDPS